MFPKDSLKDVFGRESTKTWVNRILAAILKTMVIGKVSKSTATMWSTTTIEATINLAFLLQFLVSPPVFLERLLLFEEIDFVKLFSKCLYIIVIANEHILFKKDIHRSIQNTYNKKCVNLSIKACPLADQRVNKYFIYTSSSSESRRETIIPLYIYPCKFVCLIPPKLTRCFVEHFVTHSNKKSINLYKKINRS